MEDAPTAGSTGPCLRTRLHPVPHAWQPSEVRVLAVALLLVATACGDSGSTGAAEGHPDVEHDRRRSAGDRWPRDALSGRIVGVGRTVDIAERCAATRRELSVPRSGFARSTVSDCLAGGHTWDAANQSVISPAGDALRMGESVEARGGYFFLSDIHLLAGTAASNFAAQCLDGDQIVVLKNTADAITPKPGG